LTISVQTSERLSLEQIQAFLEGSGEVGFKGQNREEVHGWVNQTLRQQRYEELKRSGRGLVRRYVEKMTGLSRAQTTRLIAVYLGGDEVKPRPYRRRRFPRRYTGEDIALLARVDAASRRVNPEGGWFGMGLRHYRGRNPTPSIFPSGVSPIRDSAEAFSNFTS
jgi:hypothetical protein